MKRSIVLLALLVFTTPALAQQDDDPLWPKPMRSEARLKARVVELEAELRKQKKVVERQGRLIHELRNTIKALRKGEPAPTAKPPETLEPRRVEAPVPKVELSEPKIEEKTEREAERQPKPKPKPKLEVEPEVEPVPEPEPEVEPAPEPEPFSEPEIEEPELERPGPATTPNRSSFSERIQTNADADRNIARDRIAERVLVQTLGARSAGLVRGGQRTAIKSAIIETFAREKLRATRRGAWILRATVNLTEARDRILGALGVESSFSERPFIVVVNQFRGPGGQPVANPAAVALTNTLTRHHLRKAPAEQHRSRAPLVCMIRGQVAFEPFPQGSPQAAQFQGYLRCKGVMGRVFDRRTGTVVAQFNVQSDANRREPFEASLARLHQPWVGREASIDEAGERYARVIGEVVGTRIAQEFIASFCTSRLTAPAGSGLEPAPTKLDHTMLRFKGFSHDEVDDVIRSLEQTPGFGDWRVKGIYGDLHVYTCTFTGTFVVRRLREALESNSLEQRARVTKRGAVLTVLSSR